MIRPADKNDGAAAPSPQAAGRAILSGGLICGVLDVSSAYLSNVKRTLPALWPVPLLVHIFCVGLLIALAVRHFGPWPRAGARRRTEAGVSRG